MLLLLQLTEARRLLLVLSFLYLYYGSGCRLATSRSRLAAGSRVLLLLLKALQCIRPVRREGR